MPRCPRVKAFKIILRRREKSARPFSSEKNRAPFQQPPREKFSD
jgi:hypothetical protein